MTRPLISDGQVLFKWCLTQGISSLGESFVGTLQEPYSNYLASQILPYPPSSLLSPSRTPSKFKLGYLELMKRDPRASVECVNILHPGSKLIFTSPAFIASESLRRFKTD